MKSGIVIVSVSTRADNTSEALDVGARNTSAICRSAADSGTKSSEPLNPAGKELAVEQD